MRPAYVERLVRFGFGMLAAYLLFTLVLLSWPRGPINLAMSVRGRGPVAELVGQATPITLGTIGIGLAIALPLALLLGIPAGLKPNRILDRVLQGPAIALMGIPALSATMFAISTLASKNKLLSLPGALQAALALMLGAWMARAVRNGLAEARAEGSPMPWGRASIAVLGRILQQTGNLLVIAMLAEVVVSRPGLWRLLVQSIANTDITVVYGVLWRIIALVMTGHLVGDLLVTAVSREEGPRRPGRISRSWLMVGGLLTLAFLVLPLFGGGAPEPMNLLSTHTPPGPGHLLGTDELGRDLLARIGNGARVSLLVGAGATLVATIPAGLLAAAGWALGGWGQAIFAPRTLVPNLFAPVVAGLAGAFLWGQPLSSLIIMIGLASIPAMTLAFRQLFLPERRLTAPGQALPALFGVMVLVFAQSVLAESVLGFMGLSVMPPMDSLGTLTAEALGFLWTVPHLLWAALPGAVGGAGLFLLGYGLVGTAHEQL